MTPGLLSHGVYGRYFFSSLEFPHFFGKDGSSMPVAGNRLSLLKSYSTKTYNCPGRKFQVPFVMPILVLRPSASFRHFFRENL